jgi:hypothetical protein
LMFPIIPSHEIMMAYYSILPFSVKKQTPMHWGITQGRRLKV